jgi:hypothetical protein
MLEEIFIIIFYYLYKSLSANELSDDFYNITRYLREIYNDNNCWGINHKDKQAGYAVPCVKVDRSVYSAFILLIEFIN